MSQNLDYVIVNHQGKLSKYRSDDLSLISEHAVPLNFKEINSVSFKGDLIVMNNDTV